MDNKTMSFNDYVKLSQESGVPPLELKYTKITDCESGSTIAFRTQTIVNSVVLGTLTEKDYTDVCDKRDTGIEVFKHTLQHLLIALKRFELLEDTPIQFLSLRCPSEIVENENADLYEIVSAILSKFPTADASKICIEFDSSLLDKQTEKARTAMLDMKLLKVRTMLTGCGKEEFSLPKLLNIPPDIVLLDKETTEYAGSRDKPQLVSSLVAYIKSMGIDTVAEGNIDKRYALRNADCLGFIDVDDTAMSLGDALDFLKAGVES